MGKSECGCVRKTIRTKDEHIELIHRLNRIEGQIRGIKRMVENDAYCPDILVQATAAGSAIDAFCRELLSRHIKTCVVRDIQSGKENAADELSELVRRLIK